MKTAKEHASGLVVVYADAVMQKDWSLFTKALSKVFHEIAVIEVKELREARNVKFDSGLIPIYKDQRKKYASVCEIVNKVNEGLLTVSDFDAVIKEVHPSIYEWYFANILNQRKQTKL